MKLESLKNGKYSLTPEKMGELVGGNISVGTSGPAGNYSADAWIYRNGADAQGAGAVISETVYFDGNNDATSAQNWANQHSQTNCGTSYSFTHN